jgi:predicted RNA-binding protein associated with RNAse of E/G family
MSASVTVHKLDAQGREVWTYDGIVLERGSHFLILQAFFDRQDADLCGLALHRGDRFVETFYDDRWYNVFAVHDRDTDEHKGWYCNITRPALLTDDAVKAEDLALDLVVFPDGTSHVLDEDEFEGLGLDDVERRQARYAILELRQLAAVGEGPFRERDSE